MDKILVDKTPLNHEEVARIIRALLTNPKRLAKGTSSDDMLAAIKWAEDLKIKAALNISILRKIYEGSLYLDLKDGEVILSTNKNAPEDVEPDPVIEEWLDM
jgi:hypothetical protein